MMQQGFYWVQLNDNEPEVWFYSDEPQGWFEPAHNQSLDEQTFTQLGYKVVSKQLQLPK